MVRRAARGQRGLHCLFRHFTRTARAIAAAFDPALATVGMTGHQFNVLMTLDREGEQRIGALARLLGMEASGIPRALKPMEVQGWVAVSPGEDRRIRVVSITASGEAALARAVPVWADVQTDLLGKRGADRWAALAKDLKCIREAARSSAARRPGKASG